MTNLIHFLKAILVPNNLRWVLKSQMKNIKKIYIAREYLLVDDYGGLRIDEEAIFLSFNEAKNFLKTLEDKDAEGDYLLLFRTEILEYSIGNTEIYSQKWTYSIKGELLDSISPGHYTQETDSFINTGKYSIGDIVYIVPEIQNKLSPSIKGTYGVIVEVPLVQDPTVENEEESRKEYTIYYITENGLLDHLHAVESALRVPKAEVPNEFKFLELYAKYFKKEKKCPDALIAQLLNEDVFIKNIKVFNFHNESILDILK